jgi:hypothetical protein
METGKTWLNSPAEELQDRQGQGTWPRPRARAPAAQGVPRLSLEPGRRGENPRIDTYEVDLDDAGRWFSTR